MALADRSNCRSIPNATLGELKAAYVSPVLAAGVSITLPDHFDQVAVYSGGHLSVADVVQTGARLRTNAPRFMYVPETSGVTSFGGNEFWYKLRNGNPTKTCAS